MGLHYAATVLWVYLCIAAAFEMEKEGYSQDLFKEQPNLPYTVDTNRYSDGFTSSASVSSTSTHFPNYVGALARTEDRYLEYLAYKASAVKQGIALFGEGDAMREDAKVRLFEKYGEQGVKSLPKPSIDFPVYAAVKWNPSRFAIQEGESYSIEVRGSDTGFSTQFWQDGGIRINAEGYYSYFDAISNCFIALGRCRPHLKKKRRLPLANWMTLACGIGEFVRPVGDVKEGSESSMRYVPLSESVLQQTVFVVGKYLKFRAIHTGMLICFANDAQTLYWNNQGSLNVTVTRESWPPSNATYYQDLYLPACDSARVVYSLTNSTGGRSDKPLKCNANGGGSGWKEANIYAKDARYNAGAPEIMMADRPEWIKSVAERASDAALLAAGYKS